MLLQGWASGSASRPRPSPPRPAAPRTPRCHRRDTAPSRASDAYCSRARVIERRRSLASCKGRSFDCLTARPPGCQHSLGLLPPGFTPASAQPITPRWPIPRNAPAMHTLHPPQAKARSRSSLAAGGTARWSGARGSAPRAALQRAVHLPTARCLLACLPTCLPACATAHAPSPWVLETDCLAGRLGEQCAGLAGSGRTRSSGSHGPRAGGGAWL